MKKTLIINLVDGSKIERDITYEKITETLGAPANDPNYARLCAMLATGGCSDTRVDGIPNEKEYGHIAPSQIKSVVVKFS